MALEPIEEGDLDLKDKFLEKKVTGLPLEGGNFLDKEDVIENVTERKEGAAEKDDAYSKIVSKIQTQSPQHVACCYVRHSIGRRPVEDPENDKVERRNVA